MQQKRVVVVGGGLSGLAASYDRTISAAIAQGRKVAKMILQDQPPG